MVAIYSVKIIWMAAAMANGINPRKSANENAWLVLIVLENGLKKSCAKNQILNDLNWGDVLVLTKIQSSMSQRFISNSRLSYLVLFSFMKHLSHCNTMTTLWQIHSVVIKWKNVLKIQTWTKKIAKDRVVTSMENRNIARSVIQRQNQCRWDLMVKLDFSEWNTIDLR